MPTNSNSGGRPLSVRVRVVLSVGERREERRENEGVKEEGEEKRRRGGREGEKEREGDKKKKKGEERGEEGGDSYLIPVVLFPIWTGWLQNSLPTRSASKTGCIIKQSVTMETNNWGGEINKEQY